MDEIKNSVGKTFKEMYDSFEVGEWNEEKRYNLYNFLSNEMIC